MIAIRFARPEEAGQLAEIGLRAWEHAMLAIGASEPMSANAYRAFHNFTRSSWQTITVIESQGMPVGWAARELLDEAITDFWIDPAHAGQGFGSALLAAVEQAIVQQGFSRAELQTHAGNQDAVRFFMARGYAVAWLSMVYAPKMDRDMQSVGLVKQLVEEQPDTYGPGYQI